MIVFVILFLILFQLKRYHVYEYEIRRNCLITFGIFLALYYSIDIFFTLFDLILSINNDEEKDKDGVPLMKEAQVEWLILIYVGLPVLVQTIVNLLKPSTDPLEGISKLDCIQIVSINQKLN